MSFRSSTSSSTPAVATSWCVNVPDVGKTPLVQALGSPGCRGSGHADVSRLQRRAAAADQLAARAAGLLDQGARPLRAGRRGAASPASFGFTNVTAPCFVPPPTGPLLCSSPNTCLFWDPFHPTYATGQTHGDRARWPRSDADGHILKNGACGRRFHFSRSTASFRGMKSAGASADRVGDNERPRPDDEPVDEPQRDAEREDP